MASAPQYRSGQMLEPLEPDSQPLAWEGSQERTLWGMERGAGCGYSLGSSHMDLLVHGPG